ncbi:MAG: squalene/phytoene synthase family protein [Candidatus Kapaibacterium sp.]
MQLSISDINELLDLNGGKYAVSNLSEAYSFCKKVALGHYENFPVGSILIPADKRDFFFSVYTFARIADDIADEGDGSAEDKTSSLVKLLGNLRYTIENEISPGNPLFLALKDTMLKKDIPLTPFEKLIKAFLQDSNFVQPLTMQDNIEYCKHSANPIGEIVLRIFESYNEQTAKYSDAICTGLQLVNFWQDISRDYNAGRIYIPKENLEKYKLDDKVIFNSTSEADIEQCLQEIYDYTEKLFIFGVDIIKYLKNKRLIFEILMTVEGGKRILEKTRRLGKNIITVRPSLRKTDFVYLLIKNFVRYKI